VFVLGEDRQVSSDGQKSLNEIRKERRRLQNLRNSQGTSPEEFRAGKRNSMKEKVDLASKDQKSPKGLYV